MLKHFNIKVDNPLVFMEQTTMKQFIQGDEKAKYEVLMQALNFKSLEQNFKVTEGNLLNMNETLKRYKDVELGRKREERDKAQEELRAVEHLRSRQEQIVELERRVAWADVQEYEGEIDGLEHEIQQLDDTMLVLRDDIEKDNAKLKELEAASDQFQQQLNGIMNDLSLQMEEANKVEMEMQAIIGPRDDADVKIRERTRQRSQLLRTIEVSRAQVEKLNREMTELANNASKKQEIDAIQGRIAEATEEQQGIQETISKLEAEKSEQERQLDGLMFRLQEAMNETQTAQKRVQKDRSREQELIKARQDANNRYGSGMANLMNRIKQTRFQQPVYGPVGRFIHVKEEYKEWIPALEMFLDRLLSSVIVAQGTTDGQTVRRMIKQLGVFGCNVIEVDYRGDLVLDPHLMIDKKYLTFLDIVDFDLTVVKKAVIMQSGLERRILCENRQEVQGITGTGVNQRTPKNSHSFVLKNGDTVRIVQGRSSYISNVKRPNGVLQPSIDTVLEQLQVTLQEDVRQYQQLQVAEEAVKRERNQVAEKLSSLNASLKKENRKLDELGRHIGAMQRKLDVLIAEDDESELVGLREQQQQVEETITHTETEVRQVDSELVTLKAQREAQEALMGPLNERRETLRKRIADTQMKARQARSRVDVATERIKLEAHIQKSNDGLERLDANKREKEEIVRQKKMIVAESVKVLKEETRVKEKLNKRSCEAELRKYKADLNSALQQLGVQDLDKLNRSYEEKQAAFKRSSDEYEAVKEEGLEMERLDKRQRLSYSQLRNEAQQQICLRFTQFLSQRKAEGIVSIDHQSKEVSLKVKMDSYNEVAASQVSNIRVLSGGEKSFVTLSLIMATAHIIESPFFIMDEFDVFMDEANRHVSLMTIIQTAREEKKQFIFITPHNLETVVKEMERDGKNSDIQIVTLADHQSGRQR